MYCQAQQSHQHTIGLPRKCVGPSDRVTCASSTHVLHMLQLRKQPHARYITADLKCSTARHKIWGLGQQPKTRLIAPGSRPLIAMQHIAQICQSYRAQVYIVPRSCAILQTRQADSLPCLATDSWDCRATVAGARSTPPEQHHVHKAACGNRYTPQPHDSTTCAPTMDCWVLTWPLYALSAVWQVGETDRGQAMRWANI